MSRQYKSLFSVSGKTILLMFILSLSVRSFAQKSLADYSIPELEQKKKEAVAKDNMSDASVYKKAITLRTEINAAKKAEDFTKAASLKEELSALKVTGSTDNSAKIKKLEADLKQALAVEDYQKASSLKKEIEALKTNKPADTKTTKSSATAAIPSIEFVNQIYIWNKSTGVVSPLESGTPEVKTSTNVGFGYAQSTSFWVIPGTKSDVSLNSNGNTSFILKVSAGSNPVDLFRLVRFQILGKGNPGRYMAAYTATSAAYSATSSGERKDNDVEISYNKLNDDHYEVIIADKIGAGEYTFFGLGKMYSFSSQQVFSNNPSNENRSTGPATTNYTKADIYRESNITWFGLDFSFFNLTYSEKTGREDEIRAHIGSLQRKYEKEMPSTALGELFGKSFSEDKAYSETLYRIYMKQFWISGNVHDVSVGEIQDHLKNYRSNGKGIGLVLLPESHSEDETTYNVEFVWFDIESKAVIHTQKISGKGKGGVVMDGWIKSFLQGTKTYVDKFYKKEKQ